MIESWRIGCRVTTMPACCSTCCRYWPIWLPFGSGVWPSVNATEPPDDLISDTSCLALDRLYAG